MQYGTSLNRYTHAWCAALGSSLPSLPLYFFFISFSNRSQAAHMKLFQHVSCISWLIAEEQALSFFIHVQPIYQPISNANTKSKQLKAIAYSNEKIEQFSFHFLYIMYLCIIRVVGHDIIYNSLIFFCCTRDVNYENVATEAFNVLYNKIKTYFSSWMKFQVMKLFSGPNETHLEKVHRIDIKHELWFFVF